MSDSPEQTAHGSIEEPPPLLRTWGRVYGFVVCYLVALIAAFYAFARALAP